MKKPKPIVYISMDGGLIQGVSVNRKDVEVVVIDYDCNAYAMDVTDPKQYDPDFEGEENDEVANTAHIAIWEDCQVVKGKFSISFNPAENPKRSSEIRELYIRNRLKELGY